MAQIKLLLERREVVTTCEVEQRARASWSWRGWLS